MSPVDKLIETYSAEVEDEHFFIEEIIEAAREIERMDADPVVRIYAGTGLCYALEKLRSENDDNKYHGVFFHIGIAVYNTDLLGDFGYWIVRKSEIQELKSTPVEYIYSDITNNGDNVKAEKVNP